jgi:hypothetical protein
MSGGGCATPAAASAAEVAKQPAPFSTMEEPKASRVSGSAPARSLRSSGRNASGQRVATAARVSAPSKTRPVVTRSPSCVAHGLTHVRPPGAEASATHGGGSGAGGGAASAHALRDRGSEATAGGHAARAAAADSSSAHSTRAARAALRIVRRRTPARVYTAWPGCCCNAPGRGAQRRRRRSCRSARRSKTEALFLRVARVVHASQRRAAGRSQAHAASMRMRTVRCEGLPPLPGCCGALTAPLAANVQPRRIRPLRHAAAGRQRPEEQPASGKCWPKCTNAAPSERKSLLPRRL